MRPVLGRLALVVLASGVAVAALVVAARGPLAAPPLGSWTAVDAWYQRLGPAAAALSGLRLVALAGAGWLLLASALQLLGRLSAIRAVGWVADAISPRGLRRVAHGAAGIAVTVALVGPPPPTDARSTAVMEVLEDDEPTTTTSTAPAPAAVVPVAVPDARAEEQVVVTPGDSFWSLAAEAVAEHPGGVAVDDYWRRLVTANRTRLVDPGNPDLLYAGQVLVLPTVG